MKKQMEIRLRGTEKKSVLIITMLLMTISFACQKEISTSIEPDTPPATAQIKFQKTYGGPNDEYIGNVQQTNDSGYVIIGTTMSYGAGDEDIYVIKVNAQGNMQWSKTYGTLNTEEGYNIKQTKDGGFILSGVGEGFDSFILMKTDAGGNIQWHKNYGYFGVGYNYDVQLTDDGGYIIVGSASPYATLCIKTDGNGNILWCKNYSVGRNVSFAKTIDGGYAIVGRTEIGWGIYCTQLIKIDANGNLLWSKGYGVGSHPMSMKKTTDGGFIITGEAYNYGTGNNSDVYVMKTDANGNRIWFKTYGGTNPEGAWEIEETTDGGYIFSGSTGNYGEGHVLVIKADSSGKVTWSKTYGGGKEPYSFVHQTKDGGFIIASETSAFGAGSSDIYLIKTDNNGNAGCYENSFSLNVTAPAVLETNPSVAISIGSIFFTVDLKSGTGGIETTLCHK